MTARYAFLYWKYQSLAGLKNNTITDASTTVTMYSAFFDGYMKDLSNIPADYIYTVSILRCNPIAFQ